jgi:hypothetical protein
MNLIERKILLVSIIHCKKNHYVCNLLNFIWDIGNNMDIDSDIVGYLISGKKLNDNSSGEIE